MSFQNIITTKNEIKFKRKLLKIIRLEKRILDPYYFKLK